MYDAKVIIFMDACKYFTFGTPPYGKISHAP